MRCRWWASSQCICQPQNLGIVTDASKHQLIPLNEDGSIIDLGWSFSTDGFLLDNWKVRVTHSDYLSHLATWKYVAIRTNEGKFLHCCRATYIPFLVGRTALTEYRDKIGKFEAFQVEYDEETEYFSFKSHNNMYLQLNHTFSTAPCRPSSFGWRVSALLDKAAAPNTGSNKKLISACITGAKVGFALATGRLCFDWAE